MARRKADQSSDKFTVGNKVARLGEWFGLTRERWAELVGVAPGTIASYKHRKNANPSREITRAIVDKYGISEEWLNDGADTDPPIPAIISEAERLAAEGRVRAILPEHRTPAQRSFAQFEEIDLPVWRGTVAGFQEECIFAESDLEPPQAVPSFFTFGRPLTEFVVCLPSGVSMAPRIMQGDFVIVRLSSSPPPNSIVIARNPGGVNFIKVFRTNGDTPELHSINDKFPVIDNLDQWTVRGVVVGIWKPYVDDDLNIEFNMGAPLKA